MVQPRFASTQIRELPAVGGMIDPYAILRLLRDEFEVALLLHEGGPTLFGQFLLAGLADELFLTMAPQIAGRTREHPRPALVAGVQFVPGTLRGWFLSAPNNEPTTYICATEKVRRR